MTTLHDRWITDWEPSERYPVYTRANASDVLPDPCTPLGQTLVWEEGFCPGWRRGRIEMGLVGEDELSEHRPENAGFFGGYLYINLSLLRLLGVRTPGSSVEAVDRDVVGMHPDLPPYVPHDSHRPSPELSRKLRETIEGLRAATEFPRLREAKLRAVHARRSRPSLRDLDDAALVAYARSFTPFLADCFAMHSWTGLVSGSGPGMLRDLCASVDLPEAAEKLISGIGDVDSAEPTFGVWRLAQTVARSAGLRALFDEGVDGLLERLAKTRDPDAREFLRTLEDFVDTYGAQGPNQYDIASDTWQTAPEILLHAVDRARRATDREDPRSAFERRVAERESAIAEVAARLGRDARRLETFTTAVRTSRVALVARERSKTNMVTVIHEVRLAMYELARRMVDRGVLRERNDLFMLRASELDDFLTDPPRFAEVLVERRHEFAALGRLEPPFFINGSVPPITTWPHRRGSDVAVAPSGTVLRGLGASRGIATGRARVVTNPGKAQRLRAGDILVAPNTDSSWAPLFLVAAGLVVEVGATISHAMIISRELGVPCVVSVRDATRRVRDGDMVTVNGSTGEVRIH